MHGRQHPPLRPQDGYPIPLRKDAHARPTSNVVPHPRHGTRRLFDAQSTSSRANHPVYNDYELHLVDEFDDHNFDDDRSRTRGANVSPADRTTGAVDGVLTGDRVADHRVLGPVRPGHRAVGDRHRLARIQLSTRRSEPHWLLLNLPNGIASASRPVRSGRLSRLVRGTVRRQSIRGSRRIALCVLGFITLATLIEQVR
jgi:hypothetical protein